MDCICANHPKVKLIWLMRPRYSKNATNANANANFASVNSLFSNVSVRFKAAKQRCYGSKTGNCANGWSGWNG